MNCPKCGAVLPIDSAECSRCGIVIAKFVRVHEAPAESALALPPLHGDPVVTVAAANENAVRSERIARAAALPLALLFAWLAVKESPGIVRVFVSMWVHESGHAVTAWLCGYTAWPGPWFTPVSAERSPLFTVLLVAMLSYGGYRAWLLERWFWVVASASVLLLMLFCTLMLGPGKAQQLITFGGDGGCLVLGTLLMLTVYAREEHPIRQEHLRWGLLLIGALAFMDVYAVWSGPIDRLPFGENENGLSDPSVLTEMYGWNVLTLIHRYGQLAYACFAVLAVAYVVGLCSSDMSRS